MLAVQITLVLPQAIRAEPSACGRKWGVMLTGRSWSAARPVRMGAGDMVFSLSRYVDGG